MIAEEGQILVYLEAVRTLWQTDAADAQSLAVFTAWEEEYQHGPFRVPEESEVLLDGRCQLVSDHNRIACCAWDFAEECAVLRIEGDTTIQRFQITFLDGEADVRELDLSHINEHALGYGERLEVIYDVVNYLRQSKPRLDVRDLSLADYRQALENLAPSFESRTIMIMHQLSRPEVRRLVTNAVEDMAADEISNQLILPLDGTYAMSASAVDESPAGRAAYMLTPQTPWRISQELDFLAEAFRFRSKLREDFILTFTHAQILEETERRALILKLSLGPDTPVSGGDRLLVYKRGERAPIGLLTLELDEGQYMIAALQWNDYSAQDSISDPDLYARPQKGPESYASSLFDSLVMKYKDQSNFESPALCAAFGSVPTVYHHHSGAMDDVDSLDISQAQAWRNAVDEENSLVVIQGPPGTGKTHVLVRVIRELVQQGLRVLVTGPSNVSVDNVCSRLLDLPVLRIGRQRESIDESVSKHCWMYNIEAVREFQQKKADLKGASVYAGTHIGLLKEELVRTDIEANGIYDVIVFDEAGMANLGEFALCASLARRAILFGDHQQLPPFPLPREVEDHLKRFTVVDRAVWSGIRLSALQWLIERRSLPVNLLRTCYRCQNPRLMRFASTLFYNACVRASAQAEYYRLPYDERLKVYPPSSLRVFSTSNLPLHLRKEKLVISGNRPGLENELEARVVLALYYAMLRRYPIEEITVITPYRRQARLIRKSLSLSAAKSIVPGLTLSPTEWTGLLRRRIATVDSFQGGESDAVIISYVRSNDGGGIGFVDDAHRINVAHTRCRRELVIVADLDCLVQQARNNIPRRLKRTIARDGQVQDVPMSFADEA